MRPDYSPSTLWSLSQPVKGWSVIVMTAGDVIYCPVLNANMNLSVTLTSNLARYSESSLPAWVERGADYQSVSTLLSSHWRWKTSSIDSNFHSGKSSASLLGVRGNISDGRGRCFWAWGHRIQLSGDWNRDRAPWVSFDETRLSPERFGERLLGLIC